MPGLTLVLEPRYKHQALSEFQWKECYDEDGVRHGIEEERHQSLPNIEGSIPGGATGIRSPSSCSRISRVVPGSARLLREQVGFTIRTLDAATVWPVEAEQKAQKKLASLIPADSFELYVLTGHFAETSERSLVTYLFRRGRPTIAIRQTEEYSHPLCALCLHPIGYYGDTWPGPCARLMRS